MVHQELSLCPHSTVAENVAARRRADAARLVHRRADDALARRGARAGPRRAPSSPDARGRRPLGRRRSSSSRSRARSRPIAYVPRAHPRRADQQPRRRATPTRLFALLRALRARGTRHPLRHRISSRKCRRVADRFTVLRDGAHGRDGRPSPARRSTTIVEHDGRPRRRELFPRSARTPRRGVVLRVDALAGARKPARRDLSSSAAARCSASPAWSAPGAPSSCAPSSASIRCGAARCAVGAVSGPASPARRSRRAWALLSEDRKGEGLALVAVDRRQPHALALEPRPRRLRRWPSAAPPRRTLDRAARRSSARGPEQRVSASSPAATSRRSPSRACSTTTSTCSSSTSRRAASTSASKAQIYALIDELAARGKAVLSSRATCPSSSASAIASPSCAAAGSARRARRRVGRARLCCSRPSAHEGLRATAPWRRAARRARRRVRALRRADAGHVPPRGQLVLSMLRQTAVVAHRGDRDDARHRPRRHRSLGRLGRRADHGRRRVACCGRAPARSSPSLAGIAAAPRSDCVNGVLDRGPAHHAVHRHARHDEHPPRRRQGPRRTSRRSTPTRAASTPCSLRPRTGCSVPPGVWIVARGARSSPRVCSATRASAATSSRSEQRGTARLCGIERGPRQDRSSTRSPAARRPRRRHASSRRSPSAIRPTRSASSSRSSPPSSSAAARCPGGEGSVFGAGRRALDDVIRTGCTHVGLLNWVQEVVTGGIIVAAVVLDRVNQRRG